MNSEKIVPTRVFVVVALVLVMASRLPAQTASAPQRPNSDPDYLALRGAGLRGEAATVSGLVMKRDAGRFTFRSGTFYFLTPVRGRVTGAVFLGDATFSLTPPTATEARSLSLLTGGGEMVEEFHQAVFRFTDDTQTEIEKAAPASNKGVDPAAQSALSSTGYDLQHKVHYNLTGRLLADVLSTRRSGFFAAFVRGKKYSDTMVYVIDPDGVDELGMGLAPEEVGLMTYAESKWGVWAGFHRAEEYAQGTATKEHHNEAVQVKSQQLDITIESNATIKGEAATTVTAVTGGVRVVGLDLYPTLRVSSVTDSAGQPLAFIQEDKKEDPQFFVILPKELGQGETFTLRTKYEGKDALSAEGNGNYYLYGGARDSWYPGTGFGRDFATY